MKYSIPFALLAADVKFTVMLRPLICSHFCNDLASASRIKLDEDRECLILKDNGFYLHSTEDPIDKTHKVLVTLMISARVAVFLKR